LWSPRGSGSNTVALLADGDRTGSSGSSSVLDLHLDREVAERELDGILRDEPDWAPFLSLVEIVFDAGARN
jgi:hypothetical protein